MGETTSGKYRRARRQPLRWYAPLSEDAPEGIEETNDHPHILMARMSMAEALEMDAIRADHSEAEANGGSDTEATRALADHMWSFVAGIGGNWQHYDCDRDLEGATPEQVRRALLVEDYFLMVEVYSPDENEKKP
jgi:hypothetical protein